MAGLKIAGHVAAALCWVLVAGPAAAARIDEASAVERSEAAIGRIVSDHVLIGSDGRALRLAELRGRPLVVSLVYTSCSSICPTATQTLRSAVERARLAVGADSFDVLTVGFDASADTPGRLSAFAREQGIDGDPRWRLASGEPSVLARLLDEVGFSYSAVAGGFEHVAQTTILDGDGRVYRQVYGDAFPIQVFVEPLKELVFGTSVRALSLPGLADRIRFLCTVYDPATGRYRTDFAIAFGIGIGGLSLAIMGVIVTRMWRASRPPERRDARA
jgi:protein SCO1/2